MNDLKRISSVAIVLLVLLRMSIGWQFLYEGLWKYDTLNTANPWSSEGYLRNAQGPFRDHFREMVGDPDELDWLDYDVMSDKWDDWRDRFVAHFGLDEKQQQRLETLLDGNKVHVAGLKALPESVDLRKYADVITFDADRGRLLVEGEIPLLPSEARALRGMVPVVKTESGEYAKRGDDGEPLLNDDGTPVPPEAGDLAWVKAIDRLETLSSRLGYRQKLAANLKGDPDRVGVVGRLTERGTYRPEMGTFDPQQQEEAAEENIRYGEIQVYKDMLADYEAGLKRAETDYQRDHLATLWKKIQAKRVELTGPIKTLETSLREDALKLLTPEQRARGPLPPKPTELRQADQMTMLGLTGLGILLLFGLFSRIAAVLGAVMMVMFYLPMPPWPGVPPAPGPEHALFINKNMIEAIALLGIAAMPTGRWFGLDGLLRWGFGKLRGKGKASKA
ncbi:hypothetical protein [Maioricimonas sp. JC845]|uniref:hypothetical protein n=1 Tax=Maioricimonas sp. JC845 TaxID=3232138 RepID=UPI00345772B2